MSTDKHKNLHSPWSFQPAGLHELLYPAALQCLRRLPRPPHRRSTCKDKQCKTVCVRAIHINKLLAVTSMYRDKYLRNHIGSACTLRKIPTFLIFFFTGVRMVAGSSYKSSERPYLHPNVWCTSHLQTHAQISRFPRFQPHHANENHNVYLYNVYASHLIYQNRVSDKQSVLLLLLLLSLAVHHVSKAQTHA